MIESVEFKKGQVVDKIDILDTGEKGFGVGKKDGYVFFVEDTVPGDQVTAQIFKKKSGYAEAKLVSIDVPSQIRTTPPCQHFDYCGGCVWQNIKYEAQLDLKEQRVKSVMKKIAQENESKSIPILGSPAHFEYRNKMDYAFCNKAYITSNSFDKKTAKYTPALGFHVSGVFDKVLPIEHCYLQSGIGNEIRNFVGQFCTENNISYYDFREHTGLMRNLVIRNTSINELMVTIVFGYEDDFNMQLMELVKKEFPQITSLLYVINTKVNDALYDQTFIPYNGNNYLMEEVNGIKYKFGPRSFFQTNLIQVGNLFKVAIDMADIQPDEVVYDLYTGVGTLALQAAKKAKSVIGIELIEEAISYAKENAELNQLNNTQFFSGDMRKILTSDFVKQHGRPDVIITDPARAGMDTPVIDVILEAEPNRIVYISCNPATQARDIALLKAKYTVVKYQPVDMFPHTYHIENIALLVKTPKSEISENN